MEQRNQQPIDPLRRAFVYNGDRFRTHDGRYYARADGGDTIRRQTPRVRGKAARRSDKRERRSAMSEKDPRSMPKDPERIPEPPPNSNPRPADGGLGTNTPGDPANDKAAQPDAKKD